ncbi:MAG: hypothetical protein PHS46_08535 [Candidatus Omnitrophica bacterium]|nr:hypothetical protein [Candidatus Omnitrophota bacterium]
MLDIKMESYMKKMYAWLDDQAREQAKLGFNRLIKSCGGISRLHLYFKPANENTPGELLLIAGGEKIPDGFIAARAYITGGMTEDRMRYVVREAMSNLPILPKEW